MGMLMSEFLKPIVKDKSSLHFQQPVVKHMLLLTLFMLAPWQTTLAVVSTGAVYWGADYLVDVHRARVLRQHVLPVVVMVCALLYYSSLPRFTATVVVAFLVLLLHGYLYRSKFEDPFILYMSLVLTMTGWKNIPGFMDVSTALCQSVFWPMACVARLYYSRLTRNHKRSAAAISIFVFAFSLKGNTCPIGSILFTLMFILSTHWEEREETITGGMFKWKLQSQPSSAKKASYHRSVGGDKTSDQLSNELGSYLTADAYTISIWVNVQSNDPLRTSHSEAVIGCASGQSLFTFRVGLMDLCGYTGHHVDISVFPGLPNVDFPPSYAQEVKGEPAKNMPLIEGVLVQTDDIKRLIAKFCKKFDGMNFNNDHVNSFWSPTYISTKHYSCMVVALVPVCVFLPPTVLPFLQLGDLAESIIGPPLTLGVLLYRRYRSAHAMKSVYIYPRGFEPLIFWCVAFFGQLGVVFGRVGHYLRRFVKDRRLSMEEATSLVDHILFPFALMHAIASFFTTDLLVIIGVAAVLASGR